MSYQKQSVAWVVLVALEDFNILVGEIIMTERTVYKEVGKDGTLSKVSRSTYV